MIMKMEEKNTVDTYYCSVTGKDPEKGTVVDYDEIYIIFVNGKFDKVEFNFNGYYTRHQWMVLDLISQKIKELEVHYAENLK